MDITKHLKRPVVCIRNKDESWFSCKENANLLEIGKTYTVVGVDIHDWHTLIELEEFPGLQFNSVLFDEVDDDSERTRDNLLVIGGARAAYMDQIGDIEIPGGLEGEDKLAEIVVSIVDDYCAYDYMPFDDYLESRLLYDFGRKKNEQYK